MPLTNVANPGGVIPPLVQPIAANPRTRPDEKFFALVPPPGTEPSLLILQTLSRAIMKKLNESGARYEGDLDENGLRHGKGKVIYIDGTYYDGNWFKGKKEGWGEHLYADGTIYKGDWKNDQREGLGKIHYLNGNTLYGSYKHD